eukprot:1158538-Pelagomonas_calceolata.AAC.3
MLIAAFRHHQQMWLTYSTSQVHEASRQLVRLPAELCDLQAQNSNDAQVGSALHFDLQLDMQPLSKSDRARKTSRTSSTATQTPNKRCSHP